MDVIISRVFVSVVGSLLLCLAGVHAAPPVFVPQVAEIEVGDAFLTWTDEVTIAFTERDVLPELERSLEPHAHVLAEEIELLTGVRPQVRSLADSSSDATIRLLFVEPNGALATSEEDQVHSYSINVDRDGISVTAAYAKGIAHGTATLLQAIDPIDGGMQIPHMRVRDQARHAYRSVMIDVARRPHSIAVLEDVIRLARLYKIRYVHLHLTDDQHFTFPFEPITDQLKANALYSRDELIGLVEYADTRGVTLIPEVDLPGHSRRLIESGYLAGAERDYDVAAPEHAPAIHALIDDVMSVFTSAPYFHIGGDESGAGERLLPFLGSMQDHIRSRDRRMIVWEGFHGAPLDILPATGLDRVLVASWESSYNPPWNLLDAGYEIINASWKPLYVVGGDSLVHPGSSGGRRWSPSTLAHWQKDLFEHWEPGRPVFEDAGPGDANRDDGAWLVPAEQRSQVVGAQISVWEQEESSVVRDLRERLPILAEKLWAGNDASVDDVLARLRHVDQKVFAIVQPVRIDPNPTDTGPIERFYRAVDNDARVSLSNRSHIDGTIRYSVRKFGGTYTWIDFGSPEDPATVGRDYREPFPVPGGCAVWARLFRNDGTPVGAGTWARFNHWPNRVKVTEYDIGRRTPATVPDLSRLDESRVIRRYSLPLLRGPIGNTAVVGQMFEAQFKPPRAGEYEFVLKTQSGRASMYVDLNRDGMWTADELLIANTPTSEARQYATASLNGNVPYAIRIDHASRLPRPVVIAEIKGPGFEKHEEITPYLVVH